jgi:hypothetical protein
MLIAKPSRSMRIKDARWTKANLLGHPKSRFDGCHGSILACQYGGSASVALRVTGLCPAGPRPRQPGSTRQTKSRAWQEPAVTVIRLFGKGPRAGARLESTPAVRIVDLFSAPISGPAFCPVLLVSYSSVPLAETLQRPLQSAISQA